jgi:hypothetical protein
MWAALLDWTPNKVGRWVLNGYLLYSDYLILHRIRNTQVVQDEWQI